MRHPLLAFGRAVLMEYVVLITGGALTAVLALIERYSSRSIPWPAYGILLFLFFSVACYRAWNKEYQRAENEKAKHLSPIFAGEIREAHVCPVAYYKTETDGRIVTVHARSDSMVLLQVIAWNLADMPSASVKDYELRIEIDSAKYLGLRNNEIPELDKLTLRTGPFSSYSVPVDNLLDPLKHAEHSYAFLSFYVKGWTPPLKSLKANLELTLVDLEGKPHRIEAKDFLVQVGRVWCPL